MFDTREKPRMVERAYLIGAYFNREDEAVANSLLDELAELVTTLGIRIIAKRCIFIRTRNKRYLTGTGKAAELIEDANALSADCIVFDNEMTPSQQRTWENEAEMTVIDREEVILDIFKMRAQTKEARLQVELARMQYSLPRLARMWSHLDRQGGGGGGGGGKGAARGEGEQQIEVDRRLARKRIDRIKAELDDVRRNRQTQRKQRTDEGICQASIVGYTNAGKSSLLNALSGASVLAEDKLFATLDPTTRRIELPDGQPLLITDTVGFVRNLPHRLVESFKATLEEAVLADFLIHVLDASSPEIFSLYETTVNVVKELGAGEKTSIIVLNKIDLIDVDRLHELGSHFDGNSVFISAHSGEGLDKLIHRISDMMVDRVYRLQLRIPQARQDLVALLYREGKIVSEDYENNDILINAVIPHSLRHRYDDFMEPKEADKESKV
ncbi:MAG: GTPase HflX [Verrucomicrobiales bacterium]|nr:GTPase HflX [Verrucomicrobiales bacterium]